ncbi:hypothetical protein QBC35DRAFT_504491 [Podospora australis]|uniref:Uncharacterized protein n=1 Tax=Podospora australis TaxID=1536484 RepID=A0AAN7AFV4_9PEZI|nr:hypothetical protein QBC35DRAFT_504491 [Podospora australis]
MVHLHSVPYSSTPPSTITENSLLNPAAGDLTVTSHRRDCQCRNDLTSFGIMESAPITKAHDHARAASLATRTADTAVAVAEHAQAAGEFAKAADGTGNIEAARTLRLLEQHHQKLSAQLSAVLKQPSELTSQNSVDDEIPETDEKYGNEQDESKPRKPPIPTLSQQRQLGLSRASTSSIANNLASARGIKSKYPSHPLAPSISSDHAPGNLEVRPRNKDGSTRSREQTHNNHSRPGWAPPVIPEDVAAEEGGGDSLKSSSAPPAAPPPSEEGFSRFYSTFGSLINRLSAPLAFAGLPLITEESGTSEGAAATTSPGPTTPEPAPQQPKWTVPPSHTSATVEPDLKKIYSRATLRSLPPDLKAVDSFYVVPTSGHTVTYAGILHHETKERRRVAASIHGGNEDDDHDDEDFVDAQEVQTPSAPVSAATRKRVGKKTSEKDLYNAIEELQLENTSLKEALDKVSKRLHAFELNSQSSHLALVQSLRLQRPDSPSSSGGHGTATGAEDALRRRNLDLEEKLTEMTKRLEKMEKDLEKKEREYNKLEQTVEKYRDRWEKLKAGAKARREAQGGGGEYST